MKKIIIDGRLGKDAEVGTTPRGTKYLRFNLANDTYGSGTKETEWWEVTTYDPFLVEKKAEILKKGRYVIVDGTFNSRVKQSNGNLYLNQYLTATAIEIPMLGNRTDDDSRREVSENTTAQAPAAAPTARPTYTAQPVAQPTYTAPQQTYAAPAPTPVAVPTPQPVAVPAYSTSESNDDDLPF